MIATPQLALRPTTAEIAPIPTTPSSAPIHMSPGRSSAAAATSVPTTATVRATCQRPERAEVGAPDAEYAREQGEQGGRAQGVGRRLTIPAGEGDADGQGGCELRDQEPRRRAAVQEASQSDANA
jgi:hypothetical protein